MKLDYFQLILDDLNAKNMQNTEKISMTSTL